MDDNGNVLVVGAQTTTGRVYTRGLALAGYRVWAAVRTLEDARPLTADGARPAWVNMLDPSSIERAVGDTMSVVIALDGGNGGFGGTEAYVTARFIEAAQREQVGHLIYSSVLHAASSSTVRYLRQRGLLEALVVGSGLPYTVLRPAPLMEALAGGPLSAGVRQSGVVRSPLAPETPVSYVAARDLGRFAVLAIENAALNCEVVDVGGPEPVTLKGLLPWVSEVLRRPVMYERIPLRKLKRHLGDHGVQLLAHMNKHGYDVDMRPLIDRLQAPLMDVHTFLHYAWQRAEARQQTAAEAASGAYRTEAA